MNRLDYWSKASNPETGAKFESFLQYLRVAHDGNMDVDAFIASEYGEEFAKRLQIRFTYEHDAMGEAAHAYYRSIGLKKELFETADFFTRWSIFTPLDMDTDAGKGKKYPLVVSHHGGGSSIETDEFSTGFINIAGQEGFMVAFLQNTNWKNLDRVLEIIAAKYPLDRERVYVSGLSQGGFQTHSASFRIPQKLTAVAPNSNHFWCEWDNNNVPYTEEVLKHMKETFVPFMQIIGVCDVSYYLPLNQWQPRRDWKELTGEPETYDHPGINHDIDPNFMHGPVPANAGSEFLNCAIAPKWWRTPLPKPPAGVDAGAWCIERVNKRLTQHGCKPVDKDRCLSFLHTPEDELHHALGIYGDQESIDTYFGYKHYTINNFNQDGINAFRLIGVENFPHWQSALHGQLCWEFFKQFRRDARTGRIVAETYHK